MKAKEVNYNYKNFKPEYYDQRNFYGPKAGEKYIDIALYDLEGTETSISQFNDKPIVIETGSNTCPMYVKCVPKMELFRKEHPEINFLLIYVREAHPGERVKNHKSLADKLNEAQKTQKLYNDNRVVLVDTVEGLFHNAYGSQPNMIYVINKEGMVLFRGDWNNTSKLKEVLHSINENKIFTEEHFEPTKPNPVVAIKTLFHGGIIAIWDFIKGIPGLIKMHRKANRYYRNKA